MSQIFERQYLDRGLASQRRYPNEALIRFIASLNTKGKALELGCGSGANLWMMAKEGFEAYGIDSAPTGLVFCKQMLDSYGVTATLIEGDMLKLPYSDEMFDVIFDVVSMESLDIEQHKTCINEILRCLKSGGSFFSYTLGDRSVSFQGKLVDEYTVENITNGLPLANNGQICFLSPAKARSLLSSFTEVHIESCTRTYKDMSQTIEYLSITAKK